jgi:hypothetical protein
MVTGLLGTVGLVQVFLNLLMNRQVRRKRKMRMFPRMELMGGSLRAVLGRLCPRAIDLITKLVLVLVLVLVLIVAPAPQVNARR